MMKQSFFLLFAVAAIDTLANPGNGYPYAAPHPEFAKRALMKRDVNSPDAAHQVHQAEYKAYINTPDGLDQASEAHQAQFAQLKAQAEAKAQQARQYAATWKAQSSKATADCTNSVLGICLDDLSKLKDAAAPAPAPAPASDDDKVKIVYPPFLGAPYGGGYYGGYGAGYYGGYGGGYGGYGYPGGYPYGRPPYYGGGGYPGIGGFGPFPVPPGYPQPGKGKTSCDDVKNSGYICNDAFNELDYCFKGYPYYFGFGGSSGAGNGKVTVGKCCYFGTCGASDDGTVGLCYCQGTGDS